MKQCCQNLIDKAKESQGGLASNLVAYGTICPTCTATVFLTT